MGMKKRLLSERDICSKYIMPALIAAGWDLKSQISEETTLTDGRIIVRGKMVSRGLKKRADYVLYLKRFRSVRIVGPWLHNLVKLICTRV